MPRTSGRRLFLAGSIVVLLFGCTHSARVIANFAGLGPTAFEDLEIAMRAAEVKTGPFVANVLGLTHILSISYSLLLLFLGAIDLTMLKPAIAAGRLRTLAWLNFGLCAGLFGAAIAHQFPPPAFFSLLALVLFGLAAIRAPGAGGAATA